eukprot:2621741-Rhodomonas_salina.1
MSSHVDDSSPVSLALRVGGFTKPPPGPGHPTPSVPPGPALPVACRDSELEPASEPDRDSESESPCFKFTGTASGSPGRAIGFKFECQWSARVEPASAGASESASRSAITRASASVPVARAGGVASGSEGMRARRAAGLAERRLSARST